MVKQYIANQAGWKVSKATKPIPLYDKDLNKIGTLSAGTLFRTYHGNIQYPWADSTTPTPSNGWIAVERAPYAAGQVWAAYDVSSGEHNLPSIEMQMADTSKESRRALAEEDVVIDAAAEPDAATNAASEFYGTLKYDPFGDLEGQQGPNGKLYPVGAVGSGSTGTTDEKGGEGSQSKKGGNIPPLDKPAEGSSLLWWVLAGGAMVAGAPIMVPAALVALGVASSSKKGA